MPEREKVWPCRNCSSDVAESDWNVNPFCVSCLTEKLATSEAALRTLRQASRAVSQKVNNAVFVTELKEEITALAAALAAEGGK